MAAKTPVVVSGVGGLSEIVEHDQTGVVVHPNDPNSLAWGIQRALESESYARRITSRAVKRVAKLYDWKSIAKRTLDLYERVSREYEEGDWKPS
jgi:glycosyltransferase involved in cell wall biosynthesis